jgi:hypothetical protein
MGHASLDTNHLKQESAYSNQLLITRGSYRLEPFFGDDLELPDLLVSLVDGEDNFGANDGR